ncbi:MAG: hypothetical protein DHS20C15_05410 [Planctomycetota bacterium]|nr:MAG: hypothetical protein DHS20C15_05410 [Planctomycetota bacterium]
MIEDMAGSGSGDGGTRHAFGARAIASALRGAGGRPCRERSDVRAPLRHVAPHTLRAACSPGPPIRDTLSTARALARRTAPLAVTSPTSPRALRMHATTRTPTRNDL